MIRTPDPERRARFMAAALKLFAAQGVQHTSTAEIAREAGAAAGTLFLYFPTKQDLIHALVLQIGREQSAVIKRQLAAEMTVRETLFTIWRGSVRWFLENMDAYLYQQQVRESGLVAAEVVQESAQYLDYYFHAIGRGLAEGRIKPYPFELIGGLLYQDIVAVMNLIRSGPDGLDSEEAIRMGFEIFWDGIRAS